MVMEGFNKNINKIGGIFHTCLPFKIVEIVDKKMSLIGSKCCDFFLPWLYSKTVKILSPDYGQDLYRVFRKECYTSFAYCLDYKCLVRPKICGKVFFL